VKRERARLTFRTKLLASYLGLVAIAEIVAVGVLDRSLGADLVRQLDQRLEQQAHGAAAWVSARRRAHPDRETAPDEGYDRQATRLAGVVGAWITIVDARGTVVGDSELPDSERGAPDGGAVPQEIAAAQHGEVGHATRWEQSRGGQVQFVAVPAENGLVVRLGLPRSEIDTTLRNMRRRLLSASVLAFIAALGLGLVAAGVVARPLRKMTATAARVARGDYDIEPEPAAPDDFGMPSHALAAMAGELRARIGDVTSERDRLSAILASMVEGVLVVGPDLRVLAANPSASRIGGERPRVGAPVTEAIRHPALEALFGDRRPDGDLREV
jgi:PAS domain-containing protein